MRLLQKLPGDSPFLDHVFEYRSFGCARIGVIWQVQPLAGRTVSCACVTRSIDDLQSSGTLQDRVQVLADGRVFLVKAQLREFHDALELRSKQAIAWSA